MLEFAELIKDNIWLSYFIKITPDLDEEKTWIDFEKEICSALLLFAEAKNNHLEHIYVNNDRLTVFAQTICDKNWNHVREFDITTTKGIEIGNIEFICSELYNEIRRFIRAFEIYCYSIINEKTGATKHYRLNENLFKSATDGNPNSDTYIVSFNYTRTFNRYYDTENSILSYKYIYPHGEALAETEYESADVNMPLNGLVLGTYSFDRSGEENNMPAVFNVFQKHNQQHRYGTLADFQQLLRELKNCKEKVSIFVAGHSLDRSDYAKLKHIFCENREANITIFYHDEISFSKYINNITTILGEEDVAIRVKFKHQHDHILGLLLPYKVFEDGRTSFDIIDEADIILSEAISDYFLNEMPNEIYELSTHSCIESVYVDEIFKIELFEDNIIRVNGKSYVECELQQGSNSDVKNDIGYVWKDSFPLNFTIALEAEYNYEKKHSDRFSVRDIQYSIDTSSFYGNE
jgi:hypothetical protein